MDILNKLKSVYNFFKINRQSGTTTLLEKIYEKEDVYVLVGDEHQKNIFKTSKDKKHIFTLQNLYDKQKVAFLSKKPILIDNYLMLKLLDMSITDNEFLTSELYDYISIISKLNTTLNTFNKSKRPIINPKTKTPVHINIKI